MASDAIAKPSAQPVYLSCLCLCLCLHSPLYYGSFVLLFLITVFIIFSYPLPFIISLVLVLAAISNQCQQLSDTTACFFTTLSSSCWPFPSEKQHCFKSQYLLVLSLWMSFPSHSGWLDPFKALATSSGHFQLQSQPCNLQTGLCVGWQVRKLAK